ncbi:tail fiber domain-containing protein [Salmonella enterica]|nr:tail fiber domain-containing protein [Salmonella enterica]
MSRNLMPKSGAMAPYVVVNRDAAVAGVFSVDGEAGAVVLTSKYLQISKYNLDKQELNTRLTGIDSSISNLNESTGNLNTAVGGINTSIEGINTSISGINTKVTALEDGKAEKGANNDITELNALTKAITIAQGGTGSTTKEGARTALEIDRFGQEFETETRVYSGNKECRLTVQDTGTWGVYKDPDNSWVALGIEQGGTGVKTQAELWPAIRPTGATPLAGDPVNPYDAATKRWVENLVGAGTTGPTLNGIMNYGIGMPVSWISRAYIPPYLQPLDGQLLERAKYPDLWAHAQQHGTVTDADWLADQTKRGAYSDGDGSTTFRLPDWNGVQDGSIPGVFFRGGRGTADKIMSLSMAPNIVGTLASDNAGVAWQAATAASGAFGVGGLQVNNIFHPLTGFDKYTGNSTYTFEAKRSSEVYGRNNASEVVPNKVSGVWCVRSSGSFVAANTSWNVLNGDAAAPTAGTTVSGGRITSEYDIAGSPHIKAHMEVKGKYLQDAWTQISLEDSDAGKTVATAELHPGSTFVLPYGVPLENGVNIGGVFRSLTPGKTVANMYAQTEVNGYSTLYFTLGKDGNPAFPARVMQLNEANDVVIFQNPLVTGATRAGAFSSRAGDRYANFLAYDTPGVDGGAVIETGFTGVGMGFYFFASAADGNKTGKILSSTRGLALFEGSDRTWKENIVDAKPGALERVEKMRPREFNWIDGGEHERGWIAQEMQEIDEEYVAEVNGKLSVKTKGIIADLIGAVQTLSKESKEQKELIAQLVQEIKDLKAK